jgi:hypothetical protein
MRRRLGAGGKGGRRLGQALCDDLENLGADELVALQEGVPMDRAISRELTSRASSSARASLSARTFSTSPPVRIPLPAAATEISESPMPQAPIICAPMVVAVARSPAGPVDTSSNQRSSATSPPMLICSRAFNSSRRCVKRSSVSECWSRPKESRRLTIESTSMRRLWPRK